MPGQQNMIVSSLFQSLILTMFETDLMKWIPFRITLWQRRFSLFLAGLFATVCWTTWTAVPITAQDIIQSPFCIARDESVTDGVQGRSYGDPHINTYDQLHYSFQTLGEYVLSQSQDGAFVVQARQGSVGDRDNLSLNTAVAMGVCGHRVGFYIQTAPDGRSPLWIDGVPTPRTGNAIPLPAGGEVQFIGEDVAVIWPSGDQVRVHPISVSGEEFLNIMTTLGRDHARQVEGLLGNFNGNPDDDLMSRGGTVIPAESSYSVATNTLAGILPSVIPVRQVEDAYFDNLYRQFGDSWRVRPDESLFDYGPGQSTATFTDPSFPREVFTLNAVAPETLENAVNTCEEAGVEESQMDGCVFDVAATGEPSFANAALAAVGDVVVQELTDRLLDEVRDVIPIPRFPF
jgi:hypothetical protein